MDSVLKKEPIRSQPWICAIVGDETVEYIIMCERQSLCKAPNLQVALFLVFSAYYCFNLEYPPLAKNIFFFIQDYILGHPDSNKKTATYLSVVSDIKRHL